jgi:hypothetical protein
MRAGDQTVLWRRVSGVALIVCALLMTGPRFARASTASFGTPVSGQPVLNWMPEEFASGHSYTQDQAVSAAQRFDVIVAYPGAFQPYLAAMRAANPDLVLLVYMKGMFAASNQGTAYPDDYYSHDASGNKIQSVQYKTWLMNPTSSGWIQDRITTCQSLIASSGYDGCMLDTIGLAPLTNGYCTSLPVNPSTGSTWTHSDWIAATTNVSQSVRTAVSPSLVVGNGLKDGPSLSESSGLFNGMDGGIAEGFLRTAAQSINAYPTTSVWQQNVNMLVTAPKPVMTLTKVWTSATAQQISQWHLYSLASFLLGTTGGSSYAFSSSASETPISVVPWTVGVGDPAGGYGLKDGVYQRSFSNGLVLVNPSTAQVTVPLNGGYTQQDGTNVSESLVMAPNTGQILTVRPATAPDAPTTVSAVAGSSSATVSFSPPVFDGGSPISGYTVTAADTTTPANGGQTQTGNASPITITGLTNGDSYTFTVTATNSIGPSPASQPSNAVIPSAPAALTVTTPTPSFALVGVSYSYQLKATGGTSPYVWSLVSGSLPAGLTMSSAGKITGKATATGSGTFSVAVHDSSTPARSGGATLVVNVYAKAANGSGSESITPTAVAAGSTGNVFSLVYMAPTTGALSGGKLRITVPRGWKAPSTSAGSASRVTTSTGSISVSSQVIIVSGLLLAPGATVTITYGNISGGKAGLTAPSKTGPYTFATKEASTSGATPVAILGSPTVTVS